MVVYLQQAIAVMGSEKMDRKTIQNVLDWYKQTHTKGVPSDIVKVCRCEHCSKSTEHPNGRWCKIYQTVVQNSDYCSWGVKKR